MTTELTCSPSLDQSSALITRCHPMKHARCGPICANVDGTARRRKRSPGIRCRIENCVQSFMAVFDLARSRDPSSRWLRNIADIASPFELRRSPTTEARPSRTLKVRSNGLKQKDNTKTDRASWTELQARKSASNIVACSRVSNLNLVLAKLANKKRPAACQAVLTQAESGDRRYVSR